MSASDIHFFKWVDGGWNCQLLVTVLDIDLIYAQRTWAIEKFIRGTDLPYMLQFAGGACWQYSSIILFRSSRVVKR